MTNQYGTTIPEMQEKQQWFWEMISLTTGRRMKSLVKEFKLQIVAN